MPQWGALRRGLSDISSYYSELAREKRKTQQELKEALKKTYIKKQVEQMFPDPIKTMKDMLELDKLSGEIQERQAQKKEAMRYGFVEPSREFLRQGVEAPTIAARPFRPGARAVTAGETKAFAEGMPFVRPQDLMRRYGTEMVEPAWAGARARGLSPEYTGGKVALKPIEEPKKDYLFKLPPKRERGILQKALDESTYKVINNIKTKQDLEELIENREAYQEAGVNVQFILNYFTSK